MRYWYVEYFDDRGRLDHNAICAGFDEIAEQAQGRAFLIQGEATQEEWQEQRDGWKDYA